MVQRFMLPGGTALDFPDDMPQESIQQAMGQFFELNPGAMPKEMQAPPTAGPPIGGQHHSYPSEMMLPLPGEAEYGADGNFMSPSPAAQRKVLGRSWLPNLEAGLSQAGLGLTSLASRATGIGDADQLNREADTLGSAADQVSQQDQIPDFLQRGVRGVSASVPPMLVGLLGTGGNPAGAIGMAMASEANSAITTGRDEGLTGKKLAGYVAVKGGIEGGIAAAFQMAGMGGAENMLRPIAAGTAKELTRQGIKSGLKEFARNSGHELREEVATELSHLLADRAFLDSKTEITPAEVGTTVLDTVTATMMTMGLLEGAGAGVRAIDRAANEMDKKDGENTNEYVPPPATDDVSTPPPTAADGEESNVAQDPGEEVIPDAVRQEEGRMQGGTEGQVAPPPLPPPASTEAATDSAPTGDGSVATPLLEVNGDEGMTANVFARPDGKFAVSLTDSDSGETLPSIAIFDDPEQAKQYATEIVTTLPQAAIESPLPAAPAVVSDVGAPDSVAVEGQIETPGANVSSPGGPEAATESTPAPAIVEKRRSKPNDFTVEKGKAFIGDAVSRRPADAKTPESIASWIRVGFGDEHYAKYLEKAGKTLEEAVAEAMPKPKTTKPAGSPVEPGEVRGMYSEKYVDPNAVYDPGQVLKTTSGRQTSPFPKLTFGTKMKDRNSTRLVDDWLRTNAIDEATSRGDQHALRMFGNADLKNMSPADRDSFEAYLFGEQSPVPKQILKPIKPAVDAVTEPPATEAERAPTAEDIEAAIEKEFDSREASKKDEPPSPPAKKKGLGKKKLKSVPGVDLNADPRTQAEQVAEYYRSQGKSAKIVNPRGSAQKAATRFAEELGVKLHWMETDVPVGGVGRPGVAVINTKAPTKNVLWGYVGHELAHATGIDKLRGVFSDDRVAESAGKYLNAVEKEFPKYGKSLRSDPDQLYREGVARLIQEFMENPEFRRSLKDSDRTTWDWIMEQLRKLLPVLESDPEMEAARKVLRDMLAESGVAESVAAPPTITDKRAEAKRKRDEALKKLVDAVKSPTLNVGVDANLVKLAVDLVLAEVELEVYSFAEFVQNVSRDVPELMDRLAPYLEAGWNVARKRDKSGRIGPGGKVADVLQESFDEIRGEDQATGEGDRGPGTGGDIPVDGGNDRLLAGEPAEDAQETSVTGDPDAVRDGAGERVPDTGSKSDSARDKRKRRGKDVPRRTDNGTRVGRGNYHLTDPEKIVGGGPKEKFRRNVRALEIVQELQTENREPTPEELDTLASYTGWGAFGQELFQGTWDNPKVNDAWTDENEIVRGLLTQDEWESAKQSIINAHYTDPETVTAMWDMAKRMGFEGGRVLEPSMGVGNFFALMPRDLMDNSQLTGIELDRVSGDIAKVLHPDANIQIKGYQDSRTPDDFYDLVISNVPFANIRIADPRYDKLRATIHNYFFAKAIDQAKPGGLVMFLTSNMTMDGKTGASLVRKYVDDKADLVAAYRFPSGAFQRYAGTKVVADLIVLRKRRAGEENKSPKWFNIVEVDTPSGTAVDVNEYWTLHPENILGTLNYGHGTTTGRPGMIVDKGDDLMERLRAAVDSVPEDIVNSETVTEATKTLANDTVNRQGTVVAKDGDLWVVQGEHLVQLQTISKWKKANEKPETWEMRRKEIESLINVRNALSDVMDAQRKLIDSAPHRKSLNSAYDAHVAAHGPISSSKVIGVLSKAGDPLAKAVAQLESKTPDGKFEKRPIFSRDTTRSRMLTKDLSTGDAFAVQRNESLRFDADRIAELAKTSPEVVIDDLLKSKSIYKTPTGEYESADQFLAGNVRRKRRELMAAIEEGMEGLEDSLKSIEAIIPEDIPYTDIEVNIGATWMDSNIYAKFVAKLLNAEPEDIDVTRLPNQWSVREGGGDVFDRPEATATWGHPRIDFRRIIEAAMNNVSVRITSRLPDGTVVVDEAATGEANAKVAEIREEFKSWVWADPERIGTLANVYNETFNSYVTPEYDGSHLAFQGLALEFGDDPFSFRKHQADAVWRGLLTGRGIYAHEVGTGKTFTMAGLAIESKRLGVAKKPVLFAHNANATSVFRDIQAAYPGARLLYVDNLNADNRDATIAQIALDDWDAIVVPHSLVDRFELRPETVEGLVRQEMDTLEAAARDVMAEDTSSWGNTGLPTNMDSLTEDDLKKIRNPTAKQLVKERMRLRERILRAVKAAETSGTVFFEDMGIDMLLVDEAHIFKKLPLSTKQKLKGLNVEGSQRGTTMMLLSDHVRNVNNGRGVHLFTGTPITNTLNELYNFQRLVMAEVMERDGTKSWDGWFNNFAQAVSDMELTTGGTWDVVERLSAFINIPELRRTIGQYLDVVFADDMPEFVDRANRDGLTENPIGRPYKLVHLEVDDMTQNQRDTADDIRRRYQTFKAASGKEKRDMLKGRDFNPIVLDGEGVKNALDPRLNDPGADASDPRLKVNRMIRRAMGHYHEHPQSTQMIFMQVGFNDYVTRNKVRVPAFNLAKAIKKQLIENGVKNEEIVVFSDLDREQRADAARDMRAGKIRFAIGSSESMGTGVNAQDYLVAMHHLDAPWMPGDLEQRNGRGWRQGNKWNTVHEYRYLAEGSHDARRWQVLLTKKRFIDAFIRNKNVGRVLEGDVTETGDEGGDMFSDTFSSAAGDPRIMLRSKLENDVKKLKTAERRFAANKQTTIFEAKRLREQLPILEDRLASLKADIETVNSHEKGTIKIEGRVYEDRQEATQALKDAGDRYTDPQGVTEIGEYRGMKLVIRRKYLQVEGQGTSYDVLFSLDSIDGRLRNLPPKVGQIETEISNARRYVEQSGALASRQFIRKDDLIAKEAKLAALEAELSANPVPSPSWVRNAAPIGSSVFVNGEERGVTGHRGDEFVLVETSEGFEPIKLEDAKDKYGNPIFVPPKRESDLDELISPDLQNKQSMGAARRIIKSAADLVGDYEEESSSSSEYAFLDKESESRFAKAQQGVGKRSLGSKLAEFWNEIIKGTTRGSLPELERSSKFGEARSVMHAIRGSNQLASYRAADLLSRTVKVMNPKEYDLFTRVIVLKDLVKTEGLKPFGFTQDTANAELKRMEAFVNDSPNVAAALEYRERWNKAMVDDYIRAHEAIGIDMSKRFNREDYFRHQVLLYYAADAKAERKKGFGRKATVDTKRGWLRRRVESDLDINANYLEAEFEVATQMIADTEKAWQIARLGKYDTYDSLKRKARDENYLSIVGGPENMRLVEQLREQRRMAETAEARDALTAQIVAIDPTDPYRREIAKAMGTAQEKIDELAKLTDKALFAALNRIGKSAIHPGRKLALAALRAVQNRRKFVRDYLGGDFKTWEDIIPETHKKLEIRPGRTMFSAWSLPDHVAADLVEDMVNELRISKDDLRKVMALGGRYTPMIVPVEIADQMEMLYDSMNKSSGSVMSKIRAIRTKWKRWSLVGPTRVLRYNIRNASEIDKVFALAPKAVLEVPRAMRELYELMYKKTDNPSPEIMEWVRSGGVATLRTINDIDKVNEHPEFRRLYEGVLKDKPNLAVRMWRKYWDVAEVGTNVRESILRYASFLHFKKEIEANGGKVKNFAASNPDEVRGIEGNEYKAARLASDLLGAYEDLSVAGQWMRDHLMLFYSFQELNVRTYYRGMANLAADSKTATEAGKRIGKAMGVAAVAKSPFLAYRLGRIGLLYMGTKLALDAINALTMGDDDDDDIPESVKSRPYLYLGRDADGRVRYFDRIGTSTDVLDWLGIDHLESDVRDLVDGRTDIGQVARDHAKYAGDKAFDMLAPDLKAVFEVSLGRRKLFGRTQEIRDWGEYLAGIYDLDEEYRAIKGVPSRGYLGDRVSKSMFYYAEPGQAQYYATRDDKSKWMRDTLGRKGGYASTSDRTEALFNFKLATRFGDQKAADKYLAEYHQLGGTKDGLKQSLRSMHPLSGLSVPDEMEFLMQLTEKESHDLDKAEQFFYRELLTPEQAEDVRSWRRDRLSSAVQSAAIPSMQEDPEKRAEAEKDRQKILKYLRANRGKDPEVDAAIDSALQSKSMRNMLDLKGVPKFRSNMPFSYDAGRVMDYHERRTEALRFAEEFSSL